ncbi:hypothetical protein DRW41_08970 [Neobacillus piezotolerans]|uniref:Uncharacterized protein n=1 Tax=Neobacillus piezotolerans TaxID=2259171 RepID=A0A3D8GUU6_9BACI|nr:hypothetical protein [Neobacillus piezotolerans]RDU37931.1 hypothetical protein DRW41_08970 [Neobacillus piezotolerans]
MKRLLMVLTLAFALQTLFTGAASAAYLSGSDKTISINTGLKLPSLSTGGTTFQLQESVHNTLTNTTGAEVDHYYYWIEVDGQQVLAVDPAKPMF